MNIKKENIMNRFLKLFQLAALLSFCYGANVIEASAAPKAINSCRAVTDSGSYILTKNLNAVGNCLVVEADNVTINLDGWIISGDGTGEGITNDGVGRKNIAVRDGVITNFISGIQFAAGSGCIVERVRASQNSLISINAGNRASVRDNNTSGSVFGIFAGPGSLIAGNVAFDHTNTGISASVGSTVSSNTAYGNDKGIVVACPSNVIGNTSVNNSSLNYSYSGAGCGNNHNAPTD